MKKYKRKIISIIIIILSIISVGLNAYTHSGRTDANGGHKDNKNKSGLGSYHYHCGGYPAHLHKNGVCPYTSNQSGSSSSSSSQGDAVTTTETSTIDVTEIKINENPETLEVGASVMLTVTIIPDNANNKEITWKSSDESVATISTTGEVMAKKEGTVDITASTVSGKTSTIRIQIQKLPQIEKEEQVKQKEEDILLQTSVKNLSDSTTEEQTESDPLASVLALGLCGGGGYLCYSKYKKKNQKTNKKSLQ